MFSQWVKRSRDAVGRRTRGRVAALFALAVVTVGARVGVLGARWEHLKRDPDAYRLIAENARQHGAYSASRQQGTLRPTAFRPPLYPILLALFARDGQVTAASVAACHLLLGILSVLAVWKLAVRAGLGRWSYLVTALVACDPILLNQSTEVMTETLATFLTIIGLLTLSYVTRRQHTSAGAVQRDGASTSVISRGESPVAEAVESRIDNALSRGASLSAGLVLGLATLCRPTFVVWVALSLFWIMMAYRHRQGLQCAICLLLGAVAVLTPWAVRNQQVMGRPVVTTTHGGYTLLLGNNPYFYQHLAEGWWTTVWDARELRPMLETSDRGGSPRPTGGSVLTAEHGRRREVRGPHPEVAADRRLYRLAWKSIRGEPAMFAMASVVRMCRFWTPLPHRLSRTEPWRRTVSRWLVAVWYVGVYVLAGYGLWQLGRGVGRPPWIWGMLCVVAFAGVHTVYWSNMRMRAPAMPVVYLLLAYGSRSVHTRVRGRN